MYLCTGSVAIGAPGDVDISFGQGGFAFVGRSLGSDQTIIRAPDGKVIIGYVQARQPELGKSEKQVVARVLPGGSLDDSFSRDGVSETGREASPLAVDEQGRVLLAGAMEAHKPAGCGDGKTRRGIIMRLRVNGTLDTSFGGDGIVVMTPNAGDPGYCASRYDWVNAIWIKPGGGGAFRALWNSPPAGPSQRIPAEVSFLADGSRDQTFGDNGRVFIAPGTDGEAKGWEFEDDGALTIYGGSPAWMARALPDGSPDPAFGGGDGVATGVPQLGKMTALLKQPSGKYLLGFLGKTSSENPDGRLRLARVESDGAPDIAFNNLARVFDFAGNGGGTIYDVTRLDDGHILLGGYRRFAFNVTATGEEYRFGHSLAVLSDEGIPSADFGSDGRVAFRSEDMQGFTGIATATGRILQPVFINGDPGTVGVVRLCGYTPCEGVDPNQVIWGTNGVDGLEGTYARDRINGRRGADRIRGHRGDDKLIGGRGRDRISGGKGNDFIDALDGMRDVISCGAGRRDRVLADRRDRVAGDCERVQRR